MIHLLMFLAFCGGVVVAAGLSGKKALRDYARHGMLRLGARGTAARPAVMYKHIAAIRVDDGFEAVHCSIMIIIMP
jgi:hypothetical protein